MGRVFGIVVAAGKGTRIGFKKQYTLLAGQPMWRRSVDALYAGGIEKVWLVVPLDDIAVIEPSLAAEPLLQNRTSVVAGGLDRADSVREGVRAILKDYDPSHLWMAVHDAARPFVSSADVRRVTKAAKEYGGAILAARCIDTIKRAQGEDIVRTVPRDALWQAQTPQVFRAEWMKNAYLGSSSLSSVTDDASLMEALGYTVRLVEATGPNGKVTTSVDLEYATWLSDRRWGGQS